jgi:phosphinothricin acetyltransferase
MRFKTAVFNPSHWSSVHRIYQDGINTGLATFEKIAPEWEDWDNKFLANCRLVCLDEKKEVVGWAGLQPVSKRDAYRGVAEVTLYVALDKQGMGIGNLLMKSLIEASESNGFWMLTASIFEKNHPSISLHKKFGFRIVGVRERIGYRDNQWVDTVLMDRRSKVVGL